MNLIDKYMPDYEVSTHHRVEIHAPMETVYSAIRDLDFGDSVIARIILWIRNTPSRRQGKRALGFTMDDLQDLGFILLEENPPHELVLGFAGEFWTASGNLEKMTPEAFLEFSESGRAKAVMNFLVTKSGNGPTLLTTDSRALCFDDEGRMKFNRYMRFTSHLRSILRWALLRSCKRRAERQRK